MSGIWKMLCLVVIGLCFASAMADEAQDITAKATFSATADKNHVNRVFKGDYSTYWNGTGGELKCTFKSGDAISGISVSFFRETAPLIIETEDESGNRVQIARYEGDFLNTFIPFEAQGVFYLRAESDSDALCISKLTVWGEGDVPRSAQRWEYLQGDADLMLIVTHPDDDLVWFGGLLPTYAGDRGYKTMVVYMAGEPSAQRKNELLDGLWTCGVTYYPVIGPFGDYAAPNVQSALSAWGGEEAVNSFLTEQIRKYRPLVLVTQDIRGEYGHKQHIAMVQQVIVCAESLAADETQYPESAEEYGTWQVQKLYLHRLRENEIKLDWTLPLDAFGGQTGEQIARKAFKMHLSQQKTDYNVYMTGTFDSQRMGLKFSAVGADELKNDIFEHVPARDQAQD